MKAGTTTSITGPSIRMTAKRRQPRAFTLLELVLVMVVVCVALAMAAPSMRSFWSARKDDDAAAQLLALTRWARSAAIIDGRIYRLTIDSRENTYRLTMQDYDEFVELGREFGRLFTLPEESRIVVERLDGSAAAFIDFFPSGRADPAVIRITGFRGEELRVVSESPTEPFRLVGPA